MSFDLPTVALSIQQPWAWLIVNGQKDIENRSWPTRFRGPVLIHAGKRIDEDARRDLALGEHPVNGEPWDGFRPPAYYDVGGIVGVAHIVDCVRDSRSPWFVGEYGFVIRHAAPLPFRAYRGALGFFAVTA